MNECNYDELLGRVLNDFICLFIWIISVLRAYKTTFIMIPSRKSVRTWHTVNKYVNVDEKNHGEERNEKGHDYLFECIFVKN
jgi:hypothetical protein